MTVLARYLPNSATILPYSAYPTIGSLITSALVVDLYICYIGPSDPFSFSLAWYFRNTVFVQALNVKAFIQAVIVAASQLLHLGATNLQLLHLGAVILQLLYLGVRIASQLPPGARAIR